MNIIVVYVLLPFVFLFHPQLCGANTPTERIASVRLKESDSDSFVKGFYSTASPVFGLLQKRPEGGMIVDIFNWSTSPAQLRKGVTVTFDGKLRGKVDLPKEMRESYSARQFYIEKSMPLPKTKPLPDGLPGDVFVLTSNSRFQDPSKWTVKSPTEVVQNEVRKTVSAHLELRVCQPSGQKPRPSPMVRMSDPTALKFVKGYKNSDDEHLLGFSIDKSKVKLPKDHEWCGKYSDIGDEDGALFLEVQGKAIYWAFQSDKRPSVYLGRGVPIDAGDYKGDGQSEFIFFATADSISSHYAGNLKVFSPDFQKHLDLYIGRF